MGIVYHKRAGMKARGLLAVEDGIDEFAKRRRTALKDLSVPLYCYENPPQGLLAPAPY